MSFALLYTDEIRLRALEPSDVDVLMRLEKCCLHSGWMRIIGTIP